MIDQYIEDFNKEPTQGTDITYLEVYRVMNKWGGKSIGSKDIYFDNYIEFGGIAENYVDENISDKPYDQAFSISLSSLSEIKHLEIRAENKFKITDSTENISNPKVVIDEKEPLTLFEFIGAILYEITWHGTPADAEEVRNRLKETSEAIVNGEMEFIDANEVFGKLNKDN